MTKEFYMIGDEFIEEEVQDICDICGEPIEDINEAYEVNEGRPKRFCCLECFIEYNERFGNIAFDL